MNFDFSTTLRSFEALFQETADRRFFFKTAWWMPGLDVVQLPNCSKGLQKVYKHFRNIKILDFSHVSNRADELFTYKVVNFFFKKHSACLFKKLRVSEPFEILIIFNKTSKKLSNNCQNIISNVLGVFWGFFVTWNCNWASNGLLDNAFGRCWTFSIIQQWKLLCIRNIEFEFFSFPTHQGQFWSVFGATLSSK